MASGGGSLGPCAKCYETFHLYHAQRENLSQRNLDCSPPKNVPFRGQPDLGGVLMPQPLAASSFPQKDLLTEGELPPLKSQPLATSPSQDIEGKEALMSLLSTPNKSDWITLPDASRMRKRAPSSAPPITDKDFGLKIEESKRLARAKYGDKLPQFTKNSAT